MDVLNALRNVGLTEQEGQIYTAVLQLGTAKASEIARRCAINRGAAYYTLKLLIERGFVGELIRSGVRYYTAANPSRLLEIVAEEQRQKEAAIKEALPSLLAMQETALERPQIEVFEGSEGFKTIFTKLLERRGEEFLCYLSSGILEYLPHFHIQFRKRRAKANIRIRTITEWTKSLKEIKKYDEKELRKTRFNNKLLNGTTVLQYILSDAIVIIKANKREQLAIYIKEENLARLHRNIFEEEWKNAKG